LVAAPVIEHGGLGASVIRDLLGLLPRASTGSKRRDAGYQEVRLPIATDWPAASVRRLIMRSASFRCIGRSVSRPVLPSAVPRKALSSLARTCVSFIRYSFIRYSQFGGRQCSMNHDMMRWAVPTLRTFVACSAGAAAVGMESPAIT